MGPIAFLLLVSSLTLSASCEADEITLAADIWCPINCDPSSTEGGIMIEIAEKAFSASGHTIVYKVIPWKRAIEEARQGRIDGIVGAFIGDAPDFVFPDNELLIVSSNAFFVRKSSGWSYRGVPSLAEIQLGAVREYDYGDVINTYLEEGNNVQLISGKTPLEINIKKLLAGRIDAIVESEIVFWYTVNNMGLGNRVKAAGHIYEPEKCYIAFSPSLPTSEKYAELLSDGVDMLRASGELNLILARYGLVDWKMRSR